MTLYRHFPSKEALFEGLVTSMCGEMRAFTSALIEPEALALYRLFVADGWRFRTSR